MHLDLYDAAALAVFAPAALNVEGEPAAFVAALLCIGSGGEQLAYHGEYARIRRRIGTGRAAYGLLVDGYDLIEIFNPLYFVELALRLARAVEIVCKVWIDYFVHEAGLARARDARNHGDQPRGYADVYTLQVVLPAPRCGKIPAVRLLTHRGDIYPAPARKVVARYRERLAHYVLHGAARHHLAAVHARPGAYVHYIVGGAHRVFVVLYHDQRIAEVAQAFEGVEQLFVVALVKADARLVEDVEHPRERAAYLRGKPYALTFAAGEGGRTARKRKIAEADVFEETQPVVYLLYDAVGYHVLGGRKEGKVGKRA